MGKLPSQFLGWLLSPSRFWCRRGIIGVIFVGLSGTLSARFYWEPALKVGTVVQQDIRVPQTITIEDPEATYTAKQKIQQEIQPIYRLNEAANLHARQELEQLLLQGDQIRAKAGSLPYVPMDRLSLANQQYLRKISASAWQLLQEQAQRATRPSHSAGQELHTLYRQSPKQFATIVRQVSKARSTYQQALSEFPQLPVPYAPAWLNVADVEWELDKYAARESLEQLLTIGIIPGLPEELLERRLQGLPLLPPDYLRRSVVVELLQEVAIPNLIPDYATMWLTATKRAESLEAQLVTLRAGQIIVLAGQKVTPRDFAFLDQLKLTRRGPNFAKIALISGSVALAMAIFALSLTYSSLQKISLKNRDLAVFAVTCLGMAGAAVLLMPGGYVVFVPFASTGFILGSFYGSRLATLATGLLAVPLALGIPVALVTFLPLLVGAMTAALITNRPHTRSYLAKCGLLIGLLQTVVYLILAIVVGGSVPISLALTALQFGVGGLVASILALGAIPYLEQLSYTLTPIRLAELSNLDRPLLRLLVTETPGTFQHTLFVANLAEAGARTLGADTALVRTGTLYHDVGKTLRPEFFIENQMGIVNPHDRVDDPWRSAQIIKEHVTGGLKLAQRHHLPEILQTFIPEHQGTIVISYFFHKAKAIDPQLNEADFRYEGPAPQSRETGIVMLADACEAALRSLGTETTLEQAEEMVMRIFRARWDDKQLIDSNLSWQELQILAPVFIRVWQERNHGRIKYPALVQKLDPTGSALPETQPPLSLSKSHEV